MGPTLGSEPYRMHEAADALELLSMGSSQLAGP